MSNNFDLSSGNFTMNACGTSSINILSIVPSFRDPAFRLIFKNTIPARFDISIENTVGRATAIIVRIISSNESDPVLRFSLDNLSERIITFNPSFQTLLYANVSLRTPPDNTKICDQDTTIYIEFPVEIKTNVPGFLYERDKYLIKVGRSANGLLLGDVTITRTRSPYIVGPIIA